MTRHHIMDELRDLPGTAQTRGETDVIDVESQTMNLPAVRDEPGEVAVLEDDPRLDEQIISLALSAVWAQPWQGRWRWAHSLPQAIREGDPVTFRALIAAGLAHGFDGTVVSPGEFEVALLEVDAARAGAR